MKNLITEQFLTIQGEGRSIGRLAYFIRFAGCNLWCGWCDSMHSVDPKLFSGKAFEIDYSKVPSHCKLIVLTGGEPTLFDLIEVREKLLKENKHRQFEVESNGTNFLPLELIEKFNWNISPKLKSSNQKNKTLDEKRLQSLGRWSEYAQSHENIIFKFVVTSKDDVVEVKSIVNEFKIPTHLVYLMPEGQTRESQTIERVEWLIDECKLSGFNFSPRLHVIFWGDKRGV
jgi:7-carboxy-7-deazaguanine synthase